MNKEWKYKEMVTMQAGGLLLTRHSETLCRAGGSEYDDNDRDNDTGVKNPIWDIVGKFRQLFSFFEDANGTPDNQRQYANDENGYYNTAEILSDKIGVPQRVPDFYSFSASFSIPFTKNYGSYGFSLTLDRDFQFYISLPDPSVGKTSQTKNAYSLTANWIWQYKTPTAGQLSNFLQGSASNASAGYYLGANYTYSFTNDFSISHSAIGVGFLSPQVGVGYSYTPYTFLKKYY